MYILGIVLAAASAGADVSPPSSEVAVANEPPCLDAEWRKIKRAARRNCRSRHGYCADLRESLRQCDREFPYAVMDPPRCWREGAGMYRVVGGCYGSGWVVWMEGDAITALNPVDPCR